MQIPEEFRDLDLYATLKVPSEATQDEIKKGYRRRALLTHPDKAGTGDSTEFQKVAFAYSVLSEPARRRRYDEHGVVEDTEEAALQEVFDRYFRTEITKEMIEQDKKDYRKSGEELADILASYKESNGDLDEILGTVLHTSVEADQERIAKIIRDEIDAGSIESTARFRKTSTPARMRKRLAEGSKEAAKAEKVKQQLGVNVDTEDDLAALIRARQGARFGSFVDQLEAKHRSKSEHRVKKTKSKHK